MKKSAQNRIIIWSIVSAALIFILVAGFVFYAYGRFVPSLNDRLYRNNYGTDYDITYEIINETASRLEYSTDDVFDINIYLSNGKVIFKESNSDNIEVTQLESSSSDEADHLNTFYYQYDYATLNIYGSEADYNLDGQDFSASNLTLAFENLFTDTPDKTIVVKIPKNTYMHDINIYTASADIDVNNIESNYTSINSVSGYINANSVNSAYLSIQNVSGNINFSRITADELTINKVSGDVSAEGDIQLIDFESVSGDLNYTTDSLNTNSISVNTVSGNANITLPQNSGFTVINSSISGELQSGFSGKTVGEHYIYGDGNTAIELNSVSGSISIQPNKSNQTEQAKSNKKQNDDKETTAPTSTTSPTATTAPDGKEAKD
ncbi:MAG: DUF4097 family beta strand repeat protein [Ruminococcus sp.]|nr:DUF4097 family beta strand repeat protein [Ruminococcus sp.]